MAEAQSASPTARRLSALGSAVSYRRERPWRTTATRVWRWRRVRGIPVGPGFHLHLHLIPRADELMPEYAGPNIFGLLGQDETPELLAARDDYARRLATRLVHAT